MHPISTKRTKTSVLVQRGGSGAFVAKNSNVTSWHKLSHQFCPFCPFSIEFCNPTKSPKCTKLVWNEAKTFVAQSRVGIFRNERTRSTPLDSKLFFRAFYTIWVHLGLFCCLLILSAKRVKQVQKFVPRNRVGISQRMQPIHPIGP